MQKIRSIQVVNVRWFNATAWYGMYLTKLLREAGHETLLVGLAGTRSFEKAQGWGLEPIALPLNDSSPMNLLSLHGKLGKLLREFRPQVVNCHRGENYILWAMLKKRHDFALVRTRGDQRAPKAGRFNRWLHKGPTDALIATNSRTAREFSGLFQVDTAKVFTILGGVDTSHFYPDREAGLAMRDALGYAPQDFVLGLLGRMDPVKGHEVVIRALGEIKQSRPESRLRFLCIGMNSHYSQDDIASLARAAGVAGEVRVTGMVDNVRACVNALDLGILASVGSEAIARAALEIMACDVPLLSTSIGVMPDLLPDALLIPPDDVRAMAAALIKCADEPEYLQRLRQAGRTSIGKLGPDDFLRNTLEAYQFAMNRRGNTA